MTTLAAVILAHQDAPQVRRLIGALEDTPVVLHCDSKASDDVAGAMLEGWGSRVQPLPRTSGRLSSWSLVRIELAALRTALRASEAQHIVVLSGADYPLVGVQELQERLEPWAGRSYMFNVPIPFESWSVPRHRDGGQWRTAHRFFARGDDLITVRGIPVRLPWRRPIPSDLVLRASPQWKIYAREDVERLLSVVDSRPDIVKFWKTTFVPDESFAASVLSSPQLTGGTRLADCYYLPWFIHWSGENPHHPDWLDESHFDLLVAARNAPAGTPEELKVPGNGGDHVRQALFARKVSSATSGALLDRIDAEFRSR